MLFPFLNLRIIFGTKTTFKCHFYVVISGDIRPNFIKKKDENNIQHHSKSGTDSKN